MAMRGRSPFRVVEWLAEFAVMPPKVALCRKRIEVGSVHGSLVRSLRRWREGANRVALAQRAHHVGRWLRVHVFGGIAGDCSRVSFSSFPFFLRLSCFFLPRKPLPPVASVAAGEARRVAQQDLGWLSRD